MDTPKTPVPAAGPGSQPDEDDGARLQYIDMPREVQTYRRPETPYPEDVRHLKGARETMRWLQGALRDYGRDRTAVVADISRLDAQNRDLVNQILGEGEVSARFAGERPARTQEAVLAGVWRTLCLDGEQRISADLLEVGDVPALCRMPPGDGVLPSPRPEPPPGVHNAPAVLTELLDHQGGYAPGRPAHVINLTLLPMSEDDHAYLGGVLGTGLVSILSRGYGDCRIESTAHRWIWRVRYFNSMDRLILDTLEVVDVPQVARAAREDIDDSRRRLAEILEPYWRD